MAGSVSGGCGFRYPDVVVPQANKLRCRMSRNGSSVSLCRSKCESLAGGYNRRRQQTHPARYRDWCSVHGRVRLWIVNEGGSPARIAEPRCRRSASRLLGHTKQVRIWATPSALSGKTKIRRQCRPRPAVCSTTIYPVPVLTTCQTQHQIGRPVDPPTRHRKADRAGSTWKADSRSRVSKRYLVALLKSIRA